MAQFVSLPKDRFFKYKKGCDTMVYTDEVRKKLDAILKAFEKYIDGQSYFDIVYSKKIGYVWILADYPGDAGAVVLDTPAKMLDRLFNELINDVVNADENKTHIPNALTLSEWEENEVRRRIAALLEPLTEDKDCYLQFLDRYLKVYQENNGHIGEPDEI